MWKCAQCGNVKIGFIQYQTGQTVEKVLNIVVRPDEFVRTGVTHFYRITLLSLTANQKSKNQTSDISRWFTSM